MFHARFMPLFESNCEGLRNGVAAIMVAFSIGEFAIAADATELPRFASINLCTDQLLMTLVDPGQILGLSPYARNSARSWEVAKASQFPRLSGEAEDVLVQKPDIVVAGRYTKRATRELLGENICGGPMLSEALDRLASELQRVVSEPERVDH
jgi:iron complex transport system substrate-binding protein